MGHRPRGHVGRARWTRRDPPGDTHVGVVRDRQHLKRGDFRGHAGRLKAPGPHRGAFGLEGRARVSGAKEGNCRFRCWEGIGPAG